jgi:hypothetical protein
MTMGTMHSDTAYAAFSHVDPDARVIRHRWAKIRPWVLATVRRNVTDARVSPEMDRLRVVHAERLTRLVAAGITSKQVIAGELDNPCLSLVAFERELSDAAERHRVRLGRVKGRGKWSKEKRNDDNA